MIEISIASATERFRDYRGEIVAANPKDRAAMISMNAMLGIGVLIGGGFPAAAAALSIGLEKSLPGQAWPWSEVAP